MSSKIVTYDLATPHGNYEILYLKIQEYPKYARVTQSCWLIKTSDSCEDIFKNLSSVMNNSDRVFIAELTSEATWLNTISSDRKIKNRL